MSAQLPPYSRLTASQCAENCFSVQCYMAKCVLVNSPLKRFKLRRRVFRQRVRFKILIHDSSIDPLSKTNCDSEMHHETSRTGAENYEEVPKEEEGREEEEGPSPKETEQDDDAETGMRYVCPICDAILLSQHDFTLHIRSHNNDTVDDGSTPPSSTCAKGYSCRICGKVLSSSSSLDRHVLVHSGERPFKCSICGVAFTTNGNMHRHMRKHGAAKPENYESDGSTDSGGSLNLPTTITTVPKKRKDCTSEPLSPPNSDGGGKRKTAADVFDDSEKRRVKSESTSSSEGSQRLQCPVCDCDEFSSIQSLEAHLDLSHPEYGGTGTGVARCGICDASFKTQRELSLHRFMIHRDGSSPASRPVMGFTDLTFVDFSSQKFPYIARAVCERNIHRPTSAFHRFQCDVCGRAFPCGSALAIHRAACTASPTPYRRSLDFDEQNDTPTDLTSHRHIIRSNNESEEEVEERKREDFFAGLDLRNKAVSPSSPQFGEQRREEKFENALYFNAVSGGGGKDLADIQSILSVTSGTGMLQDLSTGGPGTGDEEQQDCFAAEFRRMKQKGEFPCRLCAAVFPNLRALKGHNRAHLATGSGPFRCNMCPYSHGDKAVLVRHMRTHNGDRPYECALCNYAFTTKANCERHLRNRHSKVTRDEVKKSIIYHPSEDPTNDPDVMPSVPPSPVPPSVKRALVFGQEDDSHPTRWDKQEVATMTNIPTEDGEERMGDATDLSADENTDNEDVLHQRTNIENLVNLTKNNKNFFTKLSPTLENQRSTSESDLHHVPNVNCYVQEVNSPLDLSMDALDLSKKRESTPVAVKDEEDDSVPQDLSKKSNIEFNSNNKKPPTYMVPTTKNEAALYGSNSGPKIDLTAYYASHHLNPLFLNNNGYSFHHAQGAFPVHPYFIPAPTATPSPHPLFPPSTNMQEIADMKERLQKELIRGLQLTSGGSLLDNLTGADRLQTYHQAFSDMARKKDIKQEVKESIPLIDKVVSKPLTSSPLPNNNNNNSNIINNNNKVIRDRDAPSAVKMVIKNGVLMPKQKQRRYRTERPFACEHCSARFTLRSNMERHVKQQHPQFWSQRQRGGSASMVGNGRRIHPPPLLHEDKPTPPPVITISPPDSDPRVEDEDNNNGSKTFISDEVRLAIAQQLKSKLSTPSERTERMDDEEGGGDLVIDEDKTVDEDIAVIQSSDVPHRPVMATPDRKDESGVDLASVSRLLDNASTQTFQQYFRGTQDVEDFGRGEGSEEDEEGLVAGSNSEGNNSGSDENRSESDTVNGGKKKSAYSLAPNRVSCPYCMRKFPWSSSLRRHVLTHTGQKPYKCPHCPLLFTTKSNCDRHLLRKHGGTNNSSNNNNTSINSSGNSTAGSSTETSPGNNPSVTTPTSSSYTMRNVPERPYKCNHCPSSTFSTQSNLRKHVATKHGGSSPTSPLPTGISTAALDSSIHSTGGSSHCGGDDSHGSGGEDPEVNRVPAVTNLGSSDVIEEPVPVVTRESQVVPPPPSAAATIPSSSASELPFKCHLCEGGFAERQDALEHIREMHCAEYELLMSKGALEAATEDNNNIHVSAPVVPGSHEDGGDESLEQLRGKFPDYANRKVMCAFCLRRFWSAEDLRRHMRTHTGERPFSCDICRRRFTLKHSMLRHRKKHTMGTPPADDASSAISGDDEPPEASTGVSVPVSTLPPPLPPPPSSVVNHNNNTIISTTPGTKHRILIDRNVEDETDLIGNLLGIQDKSIIDKVLQSKSADDAAKLLGVKNGSH
ncbi:ras-responsive element-binding protein 1 [Anabrus simplex]|uniref:ras-responsive element-binding protein 1 n=1 Tax=Anabrus simplex TaxID=316456 RepID=UPI0035A3928C